MSHNSKPHPTLSDAALSRKRVIQHGNEASVGTAEPLPFKSILDPSNGVALGQGNAPGDGGSPTSNTGSNLRPTKIADGNNLPATW